jgi:hypothetical protein
LFEAHELRVESLREKMKDNSGGAFGLGGNNDLLGSIITVEITETSEVGLGLILTLPACHPTWEKHVVSFFQFLDGFNILSSEVSGEPDIRFSGLGFVEGGSNKGGNTSPLSFVGVFGVEWVLSEFCK